MPKERQQQIARKLEYIYGDGIPSYVGSPYEGSFLDSAELVLHELCHQVFLDIECSVPRMEPTFVKISTELDLLPRWLSDRHEVKAIAAELLAADDLGLEFNFELVTLAGYNAIRSVPRTRKRFTEIVKAAQRTTSVQFAAAQVVALVRAKWSDPPKNWKRKE